MSSNAEVLLSAPLSPQWRVAQRAPKIPACNRTKRPPCLGYFCQRSLRAIYSADSSCQPGVAFRQNVNLAEDKDTKDRPCPGTNARNSFHNVIKVLELL